MSIPLATIVLALITAPVAAETLATPSTFADILQKAKAGDNIRLAPGTYDRVSVRDRHWSPPVTVEAAVAQLSSARFDNVSGLTWHGGDFEGGDTVTDAMKFQLGDHIIVDGASFHHYTNVGIIIGQVTDARLTSNVFTDAGSDGIDVALSQRVVVDQNRCSDFHPTPGAHPDCIQLWSKPNFPPTADIVVSNNVAIGDMQGFTGFDGPYDRITIEHNFAKVTVYHGITLYDCRNCLVRHNRADSLPNPKYPNARAWIQVKGGTDIVNCDNRAKAYPDDVGRKRCRRGT